MIDSAVTLIRTELEAALSAANDGVGIDAPNFAVAGNIAQADGDDTSDITNRVVMSVVNLAEEATFKNAPNFQRTADGARYRNAPKLLNVFLLFSCNYKTYGIALQRLSQVVTFFQGKNVITLGNSPMPQPDEAPREDLRLIMDLVALTFEQVNYLWASLGGKQVPFVLYKVRLVRVQADRTQADAPLIDEISSEETKV